jgi:hypothetical protein
MYFLEVIYDATSNISHSNDTILHQLLTLFSHSKKEIINIFNKTIEQNIYNSLFNYIKDIQSKTQYNNTRMYSLYLKFTNGNELKEADYEKIIKNLCEDVTKYIYGLLLLRVQEGLCKYINLIESSVEIRKNNVITWPNFTLILPIETIMICANVLNLKNWNMYLSSKDDENQEQKRHQNIKLSLNITQNKVKAIVQYLATILDVPNLFIIDRKKNIVYYKLLYQSKIQQMKLNSIETFVNYLQKQQEENIEDTLNSNSGIY